MGMPVRIDDTLCEQARAQAQADADAAAQAIVDDPTLDEAKKGGLAGVFVYKFKRNNQLILLAYEYDLATRHLLLGSHENFYRELKRS